MKTNQIANKNDIPATLNERIPKFRNYDPHTRAALSASQIIYSQIHLNDLG